MLAATRSAIEALRVLVSILVPAPAATERAARAPYALRRAQGTAALNPRREAAIQAAYAFTATAGRHFA
ncbi:hypothetical protein [Streptomyces hydrogenans]|uniref:hypothetical protein n=1 Tax=Streptomyces hydrogenans TaxID=1873719 RepID=UPI00278C6884|nr:hypothetical protein [Streptomyces hydrogenans]